MRIRYHGIYSVRKSRWFASAEMSVGTEDPLAIRKSLDENRLPRPRQSARCPATGSEGDCSGGEQFVTKTKFWSRGLGCGSAGRYLISRHSTILLTKIAPGFARAARGCAIRNRLTGLVLLSSWTGFCPPVYVSFSRNIRSWGQRIVLLSQGLPLSFAGICALSYLYDCRFIAHHSSVCLSLFYAEFALPIDMISHFHIERTPPHFHFDMMILSDSSLISY